MMILHHRFEHQEMNLTKDVQKLRDLGAECLNMKVCEIKAAGNLIRSRLSRSWSINGNGPAIVRDNNSTKTA